MSGDPAKRSLDLFNPVAVPSEHRPRLGAHPIPLQVARERAQSAWDVSITQSGPLLPALIARMAEMANLRPADLGGEDLQQLMRSANDVRGIAQSLGSELTADVANAIFELAEEAFPDGALPRPLVLLLAQSSLHLVGYRCTQDGGELHRHVQDLLADVRLKIASITAQSR